jgi:hypothetical protein
MQRKRSSLGMSASPRKSLQILTSTTKSERALGYSPRLLADMLFHIAGHTHSVRAERSDKVRVVKARCVFNRFAFYAIFIGLACAGRGEMTPRQLRVYANRANIIDFSEADDIQPSLNISLLEGETGVTEYPLRKAAFSSINSLSLFFVRISYSRIHFRVLS